MRKMGQAAWGCGAGGFCNVQDPQEPSELITTKGLKEPFRLNYFYGLSLTGLANFQVILDMS